MKRSNLAAFFYFLTLTAQAATMVYMSGMLIFPLTMAIICFVGMLRNRPFQIKSRYYSYVFLAFILIFWAKSMLFPAASLEGLTAMVPYNVSYAVAQYCMFFQVLAFFLSTGERKFPVFMPLLGIMAMLSLANRIVDDPVHTVYRAMALVYGAILLLALEFDLSRKDNLVSKRRIARPVGLTFIILCVCLLAYSGSLMAIALEQNIVDILTRLRPGSDTSTSTAGFSSSPWFGSIRHWKTRDNEEPALRVHSDKAPGYLRARTYDEIAKGAQWRWKDNHPKVLMTPQDFSEAKLPLPKDHENRFSLYPSLKDKRINRIRAEQWDVMEVKVLQDVYDALFTSLDSRIVGGEFKIGKIDSAGVIVVTSRPEFETYRLYASNRLQTRAMGRGMRNRYLQLPENLDPRINETADEIFEGTSDSASKMRAVAMYFRTNFKYKLSVFYNDVPEGQNNVEYFLLEKPPSHCEYFATGAAIYLRLAGVPCRYATGFVTREKTPFQNVWTARNKDAHAWVEAWDEEEKEWKLVEATPPEGIPDGDYQSIAQPRQWWESLKILLSRISQAIHDGTLKHYFLRLLDSIKHTLTSARAIALLFFLAMLIPLWLYLRSRKKDSSKNMSENQILEQAHGCLKKADKMLEKRDIKRNRDETLHHFALRLEQSEEAGEGATILAKWYRLYAGVRYKGELCKADIALLQEAWQTSQAEIKKAKTAAN